MVLITHKPVNKQNSLLLEMETYELKFILSIFAKLQFIKLAIIMFENIEVWLEHHWSLRRSREEQEICAALMTTGIKFTAFLESLWALVHLKVCVTSSTRGSALLLCPVSCLLECVMVSVTDCQPLTGFLPLLLRGHGNQLNHQIQANAYKLVLGTDCLLLGNHRF